MDNFNGITVHLNHRDITMAAVSRAPYAKIAAYNTKKLDFNANAEAFQTSFTNVRNAYTTAPDAIDKDIERLL